MELLTKEIREKFQQVGRQDGGDPGEHLCVVKFFDPMGSWTWYATEFDGKDTFFGLVDGFELEWGPWSLKEMEDIGKSRILGIERDLYGGYPKKLNEVSALKERLS